MLLVRNVLTADLIVAVFLNLAMDVDCSLHRRRSKGAFCAVADSVPVRGLSGAGFR